jgi:hypothetical protein
MFLCVIAAAIPSGGMVFPENTITRKTRLDRRDHTPTTAGTVSAIKEYCEIEWLLENLVDALAQARKALEEGSDGRYNQ